MHEHMVIPALNKPGSVLARPLGPAARPVPELLPPQIPDNPGLTLVLPAATLQKGHPLILHSPDPALPRDHHPVPVGPFHGQLLEFEGVEGGYGQA
jgi:hypothetical protein